MSTDASNDGGGGNVNRNVAWREESDPTESASEGAAFMVWDLVSLVPVARFLEHDSGNSGPDAQRQNKPR